MANYLYNDAELPELPNDIGDYPYHTIIFCNALNSYRLIVSKVRPQYVEKQSSIFYNGLTRRYLPNETTWAFDDDDGSAMYTAANDPLIWTNKDVYWDGGTETWYMTGSEPVPIESEPDTRRAVYMDMGGVRKKVTAYMDINGLRTLISRAEPATTVPEYLTFSSDNAFTIATSNTTKNWDGTLYYSTDTETWSEWDGTASVASAEHEGEQRIYMRGSGNTIISGNIETIEDFWNGTTTIYKGWVLNGSDIKCEGNIECILDYITVTNDEHPTMANYCFAFMFRNCTGLTAAPELPAMTLSTCCYHYMFDGCISLTNAPELPATTMETKCYDHMFRGCTSLTDAPELPAMSLARGCYSSMFRGCTSLVNSPELPATTLTMNCYNAMFSGCTSLTNAPELPATTLADYCYNYMFKNCTSLTVAPKLFAITMAESCCEYMFDGCTSLVRAPELIATTMAKSCCEYMFNNCTSLVVAPKLLATTLATYCYYYMFNGCTALTTLPKLPATTLETYCYSSMFQGCTGIKLSETQSDDYPNEYRIPTEGTGTTANLALLLMFYKTGGSFTSSPEINTTYYTANEVV